MKRSVSILLAVMLSVMVLSGCVSASLPAPTAAEAEEFESELGKVLASAGFSGSLGFADKSVTGEYSAGDKLGAYTITRDSHVLISVDLSDILKGGASVSFDIEAYYERFGTLDAAATDYWKQIRRRGGVSDDIDNTVTHTDMSIESQRDLGAWSAGKVLTDRILFNIRRERRVELMAEGFRWDDLFRWRSFDQMTVTPYRVEGFKIWNSDMTQWYSRLDYTSASPNMSSPEKSDYLLPLEIVTANNPIAAQGGLKWKMGHYLTPLAADEFRKTSDQSSGFDDSPLYQNPYWGRQANYPAEQ